MDPSPFLPNKDVSHGDPEQPGARPIRLGRRDRMTVRRLCWRHSRRGAKRLQTRVD